LFWLPEVGAAGSSDDHSMRADWLAFHNGSGETRRFVQLEEVDVWLDLLGVQPAPDQAQLMAQWGKRPDFYHVYSRIEFGSLQNLEGIIRAADIPVYGPVGAPFELRLASASAHRSENETRLRGWTFNDYPPIGPDVRGVLARIGRMARIVARTSLPALRSVRAPARSGVHPKALELRSHRKVSYEETTREFGSGQFPLPGATNRLFIRMPSEVRADLTDRVCRRFCEQLYPLLAYYAPKAADTIASGGVQAVRRSVIVDGQKFAGILLYWPGPPPLCGFRLERPIIGLVLDCLGGATYGLTLEQVEMVIGQLVVVNDRPDLVAQYQAEVAADRWR
jgi:hypothetical protein